MPERALWESADGRTCLNRNRSSERTNIVTKAKILLIMDDAEYKTALESALKRLDYSVKQPRGSYLEEVYDEVPHLIVIDEKYREGDGRRIALGVKEDPVLRHIPVILLTGEVHTVVRKRLERIDRLVPKSKNIRALVAIVREILARNLHELDLNPLTHLPGIRSSLLKMERAIRSRREISICCIDLTDLWAFNNAYGDIRGDQVIVTLSKIIKDALTRYGAIDDFLGHLGGDDFIVTVKTDRAAQVCEAIIRKFDELSDTFYDAHDREQGYLVQRSKEGILTQYPLMRVSIAVIPNNKLPTKEVSQISQISTEFKGTMKTLPGSCYVRYHAKLPSESPGAANAQSEEHYEICFPTQAKTVMVPKLYRHGGDRIFLRSVLKDKEIRTVFQPIVDLQTKEIMGYEALSRTANEKILDEASVLFTAAREADCVKELDALCIERALKSGQKLPEGAKLFLNINHETFLDEKVLRKLFDAKGSLGFKNLVVEVTEQSLLRSFDKIRTILLELKEQGMQVAIDDVGGGAVSLRDVAILKPDFIKFDRSLIRQLDQNTTKQQIILSMILFARGIRAKTTAEGIMRQEEYEAALMCGIDLGQGHYFGKPAEEFSTKSGTVKR